MSFFPVQMEIADPRWMHFVASRTEALPFHHPAWAHLLQACYGPRPFVLTLLDASGEIAAGLPLMAVRRLGRPCWAALPYTDLCPPLAIDPVSLHTLAEELARLAAGSCPMLEVRAALPEHPAFSRSTDFLQHQLDLRPGLPGLRAGMSKGHRYDLKKACAAGLVTRRGENLAGLEAFYHLHLLTRRRLGTPVQPRRFFELLWSQLISQGLGFLLLTFSGEQPVAAAIFLAYANTVVYKYSASDPAAWDCYPNQHLLWSAVEQAHAYGYSNFHFGSSSVNNPGLSAFKRGWGASESPLSYTITQAASASTPSRRARTVLAAVLRRSPPLICRLAGELFYRCFP